MCLIIKSFKKDNKQNESQLHDNEPVTQPKARKPKSMFNAELERALSGNKPSSSKSRLISKDGSDSDSMFGRNANLLDKNEKNEMFSTDSEMDLFFKENENNYKYNDLFTSSCGSQCKTDENLNDDLDDFDKIKIESQM